MATQWGGYKIKHVPYGSDRQREEEKIRQQVSR
jgi:hypothetical protein